MRVASLFIALLAVALAAPIPNFPTSWYDTQYVGTHTFFVALFCEVFYVVMPSLTLITSLNSSVVKLSKYEAQFVQRHRERLESIKINLQVSPVIKQVAVTVEDIDGTGGVDEV